MAQHQMQHIIDNAWDNRANITGANATHEVRDAVDHVISKLPQGLDTQVGERGARLSGGQRQRLGIARAVLTKPRFLVLDEATSALDYESEHIIQKNMREIVKGRTVLVIAHRLSTVRHANRIIGMKEGRIVETGTHDSLLRQPDSLYAHLWHLQMSGVEA